MQSSSLNRIRIDTCADDGMPARDTIGMYVSGRRGSLEPTMDRKRQLNRKFVDYYSRSFGFARIRVITREYSDICSISQY